MQLDQQIFKSSLYCIFCQSALYTFTHAVPERLTLTARRSARLIGVPLRIDILGMFCRVSHSRSTYCKQIVKRDENFEQKRSGMKSLHSLTVTAYYYFFTGASLEPISSIIRHVRPPVSLLLLKSCKCKLFFFGKDNKRFVVFREFSLKDKKTRKIE